MNIEHKEMSGRKYVVVRIDANELQCDVRAVPYPTWIGTIDRKTLKINVWTPAASVPRGYRKAAKKALEDVRGAL